MPIAVAAGIGVLTLLLAALVYLLATDRDRAQAKVVAATADLSEQKTLLEAIMDSVGEGIVVIDQHGEFILTDPAAGPYLKVGGKSMSNNRWDEHVELLHSDGVTPFPVAEMPTARALKGELSQGVEMIRRQAGAEEIVLSVSARPLDGRAGRLGAVGIFHDITARKHGEDALARTNALLSEELYRREQAETELRGRENELRAFSGTVAHDLKAPLRSVSGFTTILAAHLATTLPDGLDPASIHNMDRIVNATRQMNQLIDALLAFATARDRSLHPKAVDLQALVADIVSDCTSPARAGPDPEQLPVFEVERLPTALADPVMCRQLLTNVIGNAVKYTLPGEPAQIQISARFEPGPGSTNRIRLEIRDRGIGIPPGRHEQVFDAFQRAHSGYTETGLGLAICRRIVERHGGTIAVDDNPGGGSFFRLILPAYDAPRPPEPTPGGASDYSATGKSVSA